MFTITKSTYFFYNEYYCFQENCVSKMSRLTEMFRSLTELEKRSDSRDDGEPLFESWPLHKFGELCYPGFHRTYVCDQSSLYNTSTGRISAVNFDYPSPPLFLSLSYPSKFVWPRSWLVLIIVFHYQGDWGTINPQICDFPQKAPCQKLPGLLH